MASKVDTKQGGRWWQWLTQMVLIVGVVFACQFSSSDSAPVRANTVYAPFTKCGNYQTCDLRSQFCDTALNTCGNCGDVCSPSRIAGDDMATAKCKQICGWYFVFVAAETTSTSLPSTPTPATTQPLTQLQSLNNAVAGYHGLMMLVLLVLTFITLVNVTFITVKLLKRCCERRGSQKVIAEDPTEHCRSVDDTKNLLKLNLTSQFSSPLTTCSSSSALQSCSMDNSSATRPKLPSSGDFHQSSLPVGTSSQEPLLSPRQR